jgi:type II secretory pathway component PulC
MKLLSKNTIFVLLPKINFILACSMIVLVFSIAFTSLRPYRPFIGLASRVSKLSGALDIVKSSYVSKDIPVFNENVFKQRQLFSPAVEQKTAQENAIFEFLGFVNAGEKSAVMILDTQNKKKYYCLVGDMIGGYRVKEISRDRVILESEGKQMEITR